jgi:large subunit ribosomal protein L31
MKEKIHPNYGEVLYLCASCGTEFVARSTKLDGVKREHDGKEYPSIALELCSQCHPFFSGKQMFVDTAGRVEKFNRRYGATMTKQKEAQAKLAEESATQ